MMNFQEVIKSEAYDFLRINPHLGKNLLLLGVGGSHSYGTNTESSDVDIRGIAANSSSDLLGMTQFEQVVETSTDTTVYSLNKIISLLCNCNPNVIELFGLLPEHYLYVHPVAQELLDNKHLFLSKKAIYSFGGYSSQQLWRLKNNIARYSMDQKDRELHIFKTLQSAMAHFHNKYHSFTDDDVVLYIDESDHEDYDSEIFMDISLKHYPLRDWRSMWSEMNNIVKDYDKTGKRNKKKDELHLNKHMMHLLRLYMMCNDILLKEEIITYRVAEHDLLMDVRNGLFMEDGKVKDSFWNILSEYERQFEEAKKKTKLPDKPDYEKINRLLIRLNKRVLEEMM